MLSTLYTMLLACTPQPILRCNRDVQPVCAQNIEFLNLCHARAAGFHGACASQITNGPCNMARESCIPTQTKSEKDGLCVDKPWSDFVSCEIEKHQGACPGGNDPNPWVGEHCFTTCG